MAKVGNRFAALQPVYDAVIDRFGALGPDVARGIKLRHDWGSQYRSHHFEGSLNWLGIEDDAAFVGEPQGNGVAERFMRTIRSSASGRGSSRTRTISDKESPPSSRPTTTSGSSNAWATGHRERRSTKRQLRWPRDSQRICPTNRGLKPWKIAPTRAAVPQVKWVLSVAHLLTLAHSHSLTTRPTNPFTAQSEPAGTRQSTAPEGRTAGGSVTVVAARELGVSRRHQIVSRSHRRDFRIRSPQYSPTRRGSEPRERLRRYCPEGRGCSNQWRSARQIGMVGIVIRGSVVYRKHIVLNVDIGHVTDSHRAAHIGFGDRSTTRRAGWLRPGISSDRQTLIQLRPFDLNEGAGRIDLVVAQHDIFLIHAGLLRLDRREPIVTE